jgi:hypothetical protein
MFPLLARAGSPVLVLVLIFFFFILDEVFQLLGHRPDIVQRNRAGDRAFEDESQQPCLDLCEQVWAVVTDRNSALELIVSRERQKEDGPKNAR